MKALIEITSVKYMRRMVRELNSLENGFYARMPGLTVHRRYNVARFHAGMLQSKRISEDLGVIWDDITPQIENITDAFGRNVCASRKP